MAVEGASWLGLHLATELGDNLRLNVQVLGNRHWLFGSEEGWVISELGWISSHDVLLVLPQPVEDDSASESLRTVRLAQSFNNLL